MPTRSDRDSQFLVKLGTILETVSMWLSSAGVIVWLLCVFYLCYGLFSGQLFQLYEVADIERVTANVKRASELLMYVGFATTCILVLRQRTETQELYSVIIVAGLILWLGVPFGISYFGPAGDRGAPVEILVKNVSMAGILMLCSMVIPALYHVYLMVKLRPLKRASDEYEKAAKLGREGAKGAKPRGKPHVLSPCWHLPYCRDYLLDVCPAFKAKRKCWKFGGGCFCDQRMIESMMRGLAGLSRRQEEGYMRAEIDARTGIMQHRTKKPPCKRCFIYLEHEQLKFNAMAPLTYPVAAAIIYFLYEPILMEAWNWSQLFLAQTWQKLAFKDVTTTMETIEQVPGLQVAGYIFCFVCGMFLLLGLLRFVELWCYKWKL